MNKRLFVVLLSAALGVWGYAIFQILRAFWPSGADGDSALARSHGVDFRSLPLTVRAVVVDTSLRDPFQPYLYAEAPKPPPPPRPKVAPAPKPALQVVAPPAATLQGILWGDPPVAILKQGEQSELVQAGAEAWDFKVLKIERHQVTVLKEGRQFVLTP